MDPASASTRVIRSLAGKADDVIRAYHGSPHSFSRFDASKIGTGEGAQVYGHGLYFAGNEDVARTYRDSLSGWAVASPDGRSIPVPRWLQDFAIVDPEKMELLQAKLQKQINEAIAGGRPYDDLQRDLEGVRLAAEGAPISRSGHMYEVQIDYPEEALLDYDRKLTDQPGPVLDYARSLGYRGDFWTGEDLYGDLGRFTPEDIRPGWTSVLNTVNDRITRPRVASARLMEAGIPGIRYLDQGSRSAGQGTHNYVMFPGTEDRIKILRQYGLLPPLMAPAPVEDE